MDKEEGVRKIETQKEKEKGVENKSCGKKEK